MVTTDKEWIRTSPKRWKQLLLKIYADGFLWWAMAEDKPLPQSAREAGINSAEELHLCIEFLQTNLLVTIGDAKQNGFHVINLSKKGFDVAFGLEKNKITIGINVALMAFTAVLAIASVFQFMADTKVYPPMGLLISFSGLIMLLAILFMVVIKRDKYW